jgi:hypothetical protein
MIQKKEEDRICFLCGGPIKTGTKATEEHIFSDSFLAEYDLKRERLMFGAPNGIEYSRIKVPTHGDCNSGKGSDFEGYLLRIVRSMDTNKQVLVTLHLTPQSDVASAAKEALCQWLAKLHFGLIYWETGLKRHPNLDYQASLRQYLEKPVIGCLQRCFREWHYFNCPSSLYYFSVPNPLEKYFRFNFATHPEISGTFIKFGSHLLVAMIGDGKLTEEWFGDF